MKVVERLNSLENKFDVLIAELKLGNSSRDANIEKLNHIIIGNGSKGVAERVRNLEDLEEKRKFYHKTSWGAIVALALKSTWDSLFK